MKKLLVVALFVPFVTFAAGVSISDVQVEGGKVTANGTASYDAAIPAVLDEETGDVITPEVPAVDTLTVRNDGSTVLSATNLNPWSTSFPSAQGNHTLTANVGDSTATVQYRVLGGGGRYDPLANYCWFLTGAAFESCSKITYTRFVPSGAEDCPAWFPMGCKK